MAKHRTRVGLHARNHVHLTEPDYALVHTARIETIKMMSFTDVGVFERLRRENDGIEFIVRLYDDRIHRDSYPTPAVFVAKMAPIINRLKPYATKFEIHNEPNHVEGIEGWGSSDAHALAFRDWYAKVLSALKKACPWARFGFPGLAPNHPHRDLAWLDICRKEILASAWLGCHTYWQYGNMMNDDWGLRFKRYHERFPNMPIEITEFGNSTPNLPREQIAQQYAQYYQALNKYPYLGSASAFIASSPDPAWALFVWMKESGEMLPVVQAIRDMPRNAVEIPAPPPVPKPMPEPQPPATTERRFPQTGRTVRGSFLKFFEKYGLAICGYPITEQIQEDGVPTQYFQRIALRESQPGEIELQPVGTEAWNSREKLARLDGQIKELRARAVSGASVVKPLVKDIVDELPVHADKQYPTRALSDINRIVIHHTGTSPTITAQRMAEYQVQQMGKPAMSYHFFVAAAGTILQTCSMQTATDHAFGYSRDSVGICFAGNFANGIPTNDQLRAGGELCAWLLDHLHLTTDTIVGLSELVNTQSPGMQWLGDQRWKDKLHISVRAYLEAAKENPSTLIASLSKRIQTLQAKIEGIEKELPPSPAKAPALEVMDRLTELIVSLQAQVRVLQRELARTETGIKSPGEDWVSLVADSAQVETPGSKEVQIQAEVNKAPEIGDEKLAAFVAALQAKIASLQSQLEQSGAADPLEIGKPAIQNLIGKLHAHETDKYGTRPLSAIETLVIHHSAVPSTVGPQQIAAYHVNRLDWPGVGYHFLVAEDGIIYQANPVETVSYHAAKVNPRGVGICFLGNFEQEVPPPAQLLAGAHLVSWLMQELSVDLDEVKGHKELMGTACPGTQWLQGKNWKRMLRQEIVQVQQKGQPDPGPVPAAKSMEHYMLFWARDGQWARADWLNAQDYIGIFRPSAGFSAEHASLAEYVTIIGGPLGVSLKVEDWLRGKGCKTDRIAGRNEAETKEMLRALVAEGKRFQGFEG